MLSRNEKFMLWFLRFGKAKGGLLYFLFLLLIMLVFVMAQVTLNCLVKHTSFIDELNHMHFSSLAILLIPCFFGAKNFHDRADKLLAYYKALAERGLSQQDVLNYTFMRDWEITRQQGIVRYSYYVPGFIACVIIFIPVVVLLIMLDRGSISTPEIKGFVINALRIILGGYALLSTLRMTRWTINERRFARLNKSAIV